MNEFKLGLNPGKLDPRTLKLKSVMLPELPPVPDTFDLDTCRQDSNVFGNDRWGCCVIAARAHQTLRFEQYEQGCYLSITTADVLTEYWKEQGWSGSWCSRPDNGLEVLPSLNAWRKGWKCAGETYNIFAYGLINPLDHQEVRACLYLLNGGYLAFALPKSAMAQRGQVWEVDSSPDGTPASWGYHMVYLTPKITPEGLECLTWGEYQRLTWDFLDKYTYQLYGIVDNKNRGPVKNIVDLDKLQAYLDAITN